MNKNNSNISIDESKHSAVPTFFQRLRNTFIAVVMGIIFAQVVLFAFWKGSIVLWWNSYIFIIYLIFCAVMGWVIGDRFIETLGKKSSDWWNLWGYWK